ncbi:TIR-like protein DUF1863 [Kordia periserrulae]|uniref:TIR-like protein DUF1863 n=1 Tax=Kordia periserrulae TaxID=701523 RepID=A0A2T6BZZ4_9FLAO|nr:TIR domain-containing protein [Kordia periserrulae]PTX61649.1 TIR-like protein DUF1863 [Kordia periserrulae]
MKSIFVSYVYEDIKYLNKIKRWESKGLLPGYTIVAEKEDNRTSGKKAVKEYLKPLINKANIVLVLIGDNTHNHNWITWEVEVANSLHKDIACMRIPNTTGSKPQILNKYPELQFHANQITSKF